MHKQREQSSGNSKRFALPVSPIGETDKYMYQRPMQDISLMHVGRRECVLRLHFDKPKVGEERRNENKEQEIRNGALAKGI